MRPEVSVIVPTYREAENLPLLVPRVAASLREAERRFEIVVVDDSSPDRTPEVCRELSLQHPLRLVVRRGERGLASAVLRGVEEARGELIVVMDADLSHPPERIPALLRALEEGADFALGSRYVAGGGIEQGWGPLRSMNSVIATALAWPLTSVRDPMSGFFAVRRETVETAERLDPLGYKIGLELMVRCDCRAIEEVPIHFGKRRHGESKLDLGERWLYLRHLGRLYRFKWLRRPRRSPRRPVRPAGVRGYLRHVVWASLHDRWRKLRGGPKLRHRRPLRVSSPGTEAGSALLAYLREPFGSRPEGEEKVSHANWGCCRIMGEVLTELGYAVDAVGPLDIPEAVQGSYDLLVGELATFTRSLSLVRSEGARIYLATRNHPLWERESVSRNLGRLSQRSGLHFTNALEDSWYEAAARGLASADGIVSMGNRFTERTYATEGIPFYDIGNIALFRRRVTVEEKRYEEARHHFLWLGTGPLVNKGLAPVLFAFERNPALHLWLCGPFDSRKEARTVWAFRRQLFDRTNIHTLGWMDVHSAAFTELLRRCGWVVSASYSEARSGSVVLAVANGLVPIVVPEVGFDPEDYGMLVPRPVEEDLVETLRRAADIPPSALRGRTERALSAADREFTGRAFGRRFRAAMEEVLGQRSDDGGDEHEQEDGLDDGAMSDR